MYRKVTLTEEERTAALLCYMFTCLAWTCQGRHSDNYYIWVTRRDSTCNGKRFGDACMWAMRMEAREDDAEGNSAENPEGWLGYVEHVLGNRCDETNGH